MVYLSVLLSVTLVSLREIRTFVARQKEMVSVFVEYNLNTIIPTQMICNKEFSYVYFDAIPYLKNISSKQEYINKFLDNIKHFQYFTDNTLNKKLGFASESYYEFLDEIQNGNLCRQDLLDYDAQQTQECYELLDGVFQ